MIRKAFTKLVYGLKTRMHEGGKRQEIVAVDHRVDVLRGGKGPPLVFLHSVLGEARWLPFHQRLAERFEVIAPLGASMGVDATAVEDVAFAFLDLLDGLGLKRAHVVGVSLGGWLAAEIAVRCPGRVDRLVLADALGLPRGASGAGALGVLGADGVRKMLFADPAGPMSEIALPPNGDVPDGLREAVAFAGRVGCTGEAGVFASEKLNGRLRRIAAPTLVLWGERDAIVPLEHAEAWRDGIAGAELRVLPGAGHLPHFEQERAFTEAVAEFLSSRTQSRSR